MSFIKTARVRSYGSASVTQDGFLRTASQKAAAGAPPSYYLDGSRQIPVSDLLKRVADNYAVSADPRDYIFEAIRANTTNVPNENHDGFHQAELLRFDTRLGMPVYMTYAGKPHHVNHKTDNPKAARGVIIDSHYHNELPALDDCPRCQLHTAARQNRDDTGIHCGRCGHVVKDEFVEILVGVDVKKDPAFARGVRNGQLNAGSMGCNCLSTTCNVCSHVAYSRPEFCEHIRAGNKGSLWKRQGSLWTRTSIHEVGREASRFGYNWDPADFCFLRTKSGFEVRKAFEYCNQVIFDEYSRVDQPADPKARQREILKAASVVVPAALHMPGHVPTPEELRMETEGLIRAADMHRAASKKTAEQFVVIRIDGDEGDMHAAPTIEEALEVAGIEADEGLRVEYCEVEAEDPIAAVEMFDEAQAKDLNEKDADIVVQAPPDEPVVVEPQEPGGDGQPGAPPPGQSPQSIEDYQDQEMAPAEPSPQDQLSPAEMGVMPPGASAPVRAERRSSHPMRFANTYKGWTVEVSDQGNARVLNASKEPVLVVRGRPEKDRQKRYAFARRVMASVLTNGLIKTASDMKGMLTPKVAQVVDGAIDDMKEFADKYMHDSTRDNYADDMQGEQRGTPPSRVPDDYSDDMQDARGTPPKSTQDDGAVDHSEGKPEGVDSVTQEDNNDMAHKRDKMNLGSDSVLDDEAHDHAMSLTAMLRPGARVAHKKLPKVPWMVRLSALREDGEVEITVTADGHAPRRIAQSDLAKHWFALDRAPSSRAAEKDDDKDDKFPFKSKSKDKDDEDDDDDDDDKEKEAARRQAAFVKRHKKATASRIAKLKKAHAKELEQTKKAAVTSFCRALRIVARRQSANLEQSPLRTASEQALATPRPLGVDPITQAQVEFPGMDLELARFLTAQVMQAGHSEHLENLMNRAADLAAKGDKYLIDAEADAANFQPALPTITASSVHPLSPEASHAVQMRQAAMGGNFNVNASPSVEEAPQGGFNDKRAAIRGVVQSTSTVGQLDRLRAR